MWLSDADATVESRLSVLTPGDIGVRKLCIV